VTEELYRNPSPEDADQDGVSPATILFGVILLTLGGLWLLDVAGAISVTWTLVGSIMLILIGILLIVAARQDSHGGMIFLGIVLSAIVLLGSLASWPSFDGGVGDQQIAPHTFTEVEREYAWSVGNQEVDLSNVEFPDGETEILIRLGTGNLEVTMPEDVGYRITWSVGLGNADIFEENHTGIGLDGTKEEDVDADAVIVLELSVGLGNLEVYQ
jgi:hypothetical protein